MANEDVFRNIVREIVQQALTEFYKTYETDGTYKPENSRSPSAYYAPWTGVEYEAHPSRQQFNIGEATVATSDLLEFVELKLCSIEKNKPCDQCGMCRSLGFQEFATTHRLPIFANSLLKTATYYRKSLSSTKT